MTIGGCDLEYCELAIVKKQFVIIVNLVLRYFIVVRKNRNHVIFGYNFNNLSESHHEIVIASDENSLFSLTRQIIGIHGFAAQGPQGHRHLQTFLLCCPHFGVSRIVEDSLGLFKCHVQDCRWDIDTPSITIREMKMRTEESVQTYCPQWYTNILR